MDRDDSVSPSFDRARPGDAPAGEIHVSGIGLQQAGNDVDERALAGAVFANQPMNFAGGE